MGEDAREMLADHRAKFRKKGNRTKKKTSVSARRIPVAWGGHTPLPLLAAWLAAWLNPDWIGQWAVRRRHGFLSQ